MSAPEASAVPGATNGPDRDAAGALQHERALRTPARPMAFSFEEFRSGAWRAAWTFQIAFALSYPLIVLTGGLAAGRPFEEALTMMLGYAPFGILMTFIVSLPFAGAALFFVGGPAAWVLGRALDRVRSKAVHVAAFAGLGLAVGSATAVVEGLLVRGTGSPLIVGFAAITTGACVVHGWWHAASRALHWKASAGQVWA